MSRSVETFLFSFFSQLVLNHDRRAKCRLIYSIEKRGMSFKDDIVAEVAEVVLRRKQNGAERSRAEQSKAKQSVLGLPARGPEARRGARIRGTGPRVFRR